MDRANSRRFISSASCSQPLAPGAARSTAKTPASYTRLRAVEKHVAFDSTPSQRESLPDRRLLGEAEPEYDGYGEQSE